MAVLIRFMLDAIHGCYVIRMRRRFLVLLALFTAPVWACTCSLPTTRANLRKSDAVFLGRIRRIEKGYVDFDVELWWKGGAARTFQMPAIEETVSCGGFRGEQLKVGAILLVFAQKGARVNGKFQYYTSICDRTTTLQYAGVDLAILGIGFKP